MVGRKGNKKRKRESQEEGPAQAEAGGMGKCHRMGSTWKGADWLELGVALGLTCASNFFTSPVPELKGPPVGDVAAPTQPSPPTLWQGAPALL